MLMKHLSLTVILMMTAITLSAQYQYKLSSYHDIYNQESVGYRYDDQHRLIAIQSIVSGMDGYDVIDSVTYDNNGDMVKICGWQILASAMWERVFVNYVDYTYDAQHRITSRKNYNNFGGEWSLGGTYTYEYNNDGQLSKRSLNFSSTLFEEVTYTYENGLLVEELWKNDYDYTGLAPSEKFIYSYDANNRLVSIKDSTCKNNVYSAFRRHELTYDNDGNCLCHKVFDADNSEVERHSYTYCDKLKSETLIPSTPEMVMYDSRPKDLQHNQNVYTKEEYWGLDADFVLQHITDYIFTYIGINEVGVDNVNEDVVREVMSAHKVMIDGRVYIERGNMLYDLNGRRVR